MRYLLGLALLVVCLNMSAQYGSAEQPEKTITDSEELWLGAYTKYRIGQRTFYYGEYHYRRRNNFIQDMAQIYLRFGLTYLVNPKFELTAGVVTPIYWAPTSLDPDLIDPVVMQYRLWQQALFVQPVGHVKFYHQIRTEQRWRRDYEKNSSFELTWRFRYKIMAYIPLNKPDLIPGTLFGVAYDEIFIQAGKPIKYNYLEDNRLFFGLGYIINPSLQVQAGYMWTFRHTNSPFNYENRHIPRFSVYHTLDLTKRDIRRRQQMPIILREDF